MRMTPLPYIIKSTPLRSGERYEFELYVYIEASMGVKKSESVDLIYKDKTQAEIEGFILILDRDLGFSLEIGTEADPLPIELLAQMKRKRGLG